MSQDKSMIGVKEGKSKENIIERRIFSVPHIKQLTRSENQHAQYSKVREVVLIESDGNESSLLSILECGLQPCELSCFSKSSEGNVQFDRSNLKLFREDFATMKGSNLLEGFQQDISNRSQTDVNNPAPLKPIIDSLNQNGRKLLKCHFVTFRNNMNKILATPYNKNQDWTLRLQRHDDVVYLDVQMTQKEKENQIAPIHDEHAKASYAGRYFETLATKQALDLQCEAIETTPRSADKFSIAGQNQGEFCSVLSASLGGKKLILAAEVDCRESNGNYVELKTYRSIKSDKDQYKFERYKLLAFWIQSFLGGVPRIVCAFRDHDFTICEMQNFVTAKLPSYTKSWNRHVCINFADDFLEWLYRHTDNEQTYKVTYFSSLGQIELVQLDHINDQFLENFISFHK